MRCLEDMRQADAPLVGGPRAERKSPLVGAPRAERKGHATRELAEGPASEELLVRAVSGKRDVARTGESFAGCWECWLPCEALQLSMLGSSLSLSRGTGGLRQLRSCSPSSLTCAATALLPCMAGSAGCEAMPHAAADCKNPGC